MSKSAFVRSNAMKQSIGNFLLRRLKEAGVKHIFGVPGDYNLALMQQLEDLGDPAWIGNCNELNASYASDATWRFDAPYSRPSRKRELLSHVRQGDRGPGATPENAVAEIDRLILTA